MSNISVICDDVYVSKSKTRHREDEMEVSLEGVDESEVLGVLGDSEISQYASDNCLSDVIEHADVSEVLDLIDYDDVKKHFMNDIIDELSGLEDEVLEAIGWPTVRDHYNDVIDAEASDIAQDLVERGVE